MIEQKIPSILIVDDSQSDIYLAKDYLVQADICDKVYVCNDGQEAFDFLVERKERMYDLDDTDCGLPAMILLDINMPRLDGFGLLDKLEETGLYNNNENLSTIVMLSTSDYSGDITRASKIGQVKGFITKPLTGNHAETLLDLYSGQNNKAA